MLILKYKQIKRTEVWLKIWVFTRFQFILLVFNLTLNFLSSQCSLDSLSKIAYVALIGLMPCNMLTSNFLFFWKSAQIQKKKDGKWVACVTLSPKSRGGSRSHLQPWGGCASNHFCWHCKPILSWEVIVQGTPIASFATLFQLFFFFFLFLEFWYF